MSSSHSMLSRNDQYSESVTHPPNTGFWSSFKGQWDLCLFAALLALVSFSLPGRGSKDMTGGIDAIAIAKLLIRFAACGWFGALIYWRQLAPGRTWTDWISPLLVPWFLFWGWSGCSILWSPLRVVSLGQWVGLTALLLMAQIIAMRLSESKTMVRWPVILSATFWILTLYSAAVLTVHLLAPQASGLDRSLTFEGSNGFVHPTAAGATSSLGLVWSVYWLSVRASNRRWTLVGAALVHGGVLFLSNSRSSLVMAMVCLLPYLFFFYSLRVRALALLVVGLGSLFWVVVDPGFELMESSLGGVSSYVARGQTADQLRAVSGRGEMWAAVWEQYQKSPLVGHGYFVTSSNGKLDVWDGPANHDAHNIGLQVLVSTGVVGGMFFLWAVGRAVIALFGQQVRQGDQRASQHGIERDILVFLLILMVWFAGWSQGCVTFLGPVRPESVAFFVALGVLAGVVAAGKKSAGRSGSTSEISPWGVSG